METNLFLLASEATEHSGFGINSDILETNVINLAIVVALLVYAGRGFLGKLLSQRLNAIESAISEAEQRQKTAESQLAIQQQNLAQAQVECDRLKAQAEADAKTAKEAILASVAADIERPKAAAGQEIASEQERVLVQLRSSVVEKALVNARAYFDRGLSEDVQRELIDRSITLLGS